MSGLGLGAGHSLVNKTEALVFAEFILHMYLLFCTFADVVLIYVCFQNLSLKKYISFLLSRAHLL